MTRAALSITPFAASILDGPLREGRVGWRGLLYFEGAVLVLTPPGAPRQPNGIETSVHLTPGDKVVAGEGALRAGRSVITGGPVWDPRPNPKVALSVRPRPRLDPDSLIGWGPGATPLGDDVAIGYHAAAALRGRRVPVTHTPATALSRTLLDLAQNGALPEAAHVLLEEGDPEPLLGLDHGSGGGIVLGLALGGVAPRGRPRRRFALSLPLGTFDVAVGAPPPC